MTDIVIPESGMSFGPFPPGSCFRIEKSPFLAGLGDGIKSAEMILLRDGKLWVIEAKSSSPKPETQPRFAEFLGEIRQKLENSLFLTLALRLGRHGEAASRELPQPFGAIPATTKVVFLLVIKGHPEAWLHPLKDALAVELAILCRCFGGCEVVVFNDDLAARRGLLAGGPATP